MDLVEVELINLLKLGKVAGLKTVPRFIETVISRVFIFDEENVVLKVYKRDNLFWNTNMHDLSKGATRSDFIREDFEFNRFVSPKTYLELKGVEIAGDAVILVDPRPGEDELIIVMNKEEVMESLTEVLYKRKLEKDDYVLIGKKFAQMKLSLPKSFLPKIDKTPQEQIQARFHDLASWTSSEEDFSQELATRGLSYLQSFFKENPQEFSIDPKELAVSIDCNSENLIYTKRELRFIDVYSAKKEWRIAPHEIDIYRVGCDVLVLDGEQAYRDFITGVKTVEGIRLNEKIEKFCLVYSALIAAPYLVMLSKNNSQYLPKADRYLTFLKDFLNA